MNVVSITGPDITLRLDVDGVIRDVALSNSLAQEDVSPWLGRSWVLTVTDETVSKVRRMVDDALRREVSAFRQVTQRFPSGLEVLIEYTTVRLGDGAGLIAVGKSLQAVTEQQSRLMAAQQEVEREYWKVRELESRYRLLFDNSSEAVLLVRAANLRMAEANPAAAKALDLGSGHGHGVSDRDFLDLVVPQERAAVEALLRTVAEQGKAPGILAHLGRMGYPWLIRASVVTADTGLLFLLQLSPGGLGEHDEAESSSLLRDAVHGAAEPIVVLDRGGQVVFANAAFARSTGVSTNADVIGTHFERWFGDGGSVLNALRERITERLNTPVAAEFSPAEGHAAVPVSLFVLRPEDAAAPSFGVLMIERPSGDGTRADPPH